MFLLAAAALSSPVPNHSAAFAVAQATATIRVVRAVEIRLDGSANRDAPPARMAVVTSADGTPRIVRLIEFE